ncbi:MAG: HIT domain-containing protein [Deltaproteobacteria bacterium]|nr:HIT domain-containing protein [Deltaproteobacteria bacterium]
MDNLWAPWRMEYINDTRKGEKQGCVFCEMKEQKPDDKNLILARGKHTYVLMNRFPYNSGHLLIVSYSHIASLKDLSAEIQQEMMWFMGESMDILKDVLKAQGFNCGLNAGAHAGGGIPDHIHWHVVPRWPGDTNFLPVLGNTRSMPEYLSETYKRLEGKFKTLGRVS